jgi:DNA polymerase-1
VGKPLLIVDGDNLAHRAYHSTPKSVTGKDGAPLNAIVGWTSMLMRVWQEEQPRAIFVAWDTLGVDTYRNKLWPPYQTGRIFDREIVQQLNLFPTVCEAFGFGVGKAAGYEADDFMAAACTQEVAAGGSVLLYTTDKDSYQLVSERVTMIAPKKGTRELDRIGPHEVVARFGVLPEQVPDFKALSGDASDKIPGLRGIGPKSAADLLLKYGSLEAVLDAWPKPEEVELALRFREVTRMRHDAPAELPTGGPDWRSGASALRALGAENLAERVAALALE